MTTNEMTEERLAYANQYFEMLARRTNLEAGSLGFALLTEIVRLRAELAARDAEVERLKAFPEDIVNNRNPDGFYPCGCELYGFEPANHEDECYVRRAWLALNPEPATAPVCECVGGIDSTHCLLHGEPAS